MTVELTYLGLTAILAACLWIPYIIGVNGQPAVEGENSFLRPPDLKNMPPWVHRAHRAHLNLLEQLLPFAVIVLMASQLGVSTAITAIASALFFWIRIAHAVGMISGLATMPVRPILFSLGWICILVIAWEVFANERVG